MTIEQLLNELEKPENHDKIPHLANLSHLDNLDNLKDMRGVGGFISKIVLSFTKKHKDAFVALSECEDAEDIATFKHTPHFSKIKSSVVEGLNLEDLGELAELSELKELQNLNRND